MKTLQRWIPVLATLFLCGCFQIQDELTIQPDGSGKVSLTVHSILPEETMGMMGGMARFGVSASGIIYPPTSEAEAKRFSRRRISR